jgi:hypothetical protein
MDRLRPSPIVFRATSRHILARAARQQMLYQPRCGLTLIKPHWTSRRQLGEVGSDSLNKDGRWPQIANS